MINSKHYDYTQPSPTGGKRNTENRDGTTAGLTHPRRNMFHVEIPTGPRARKCLSFDIVSAVNFSIFYFFLLLHLGHDAFSCDFAGIRREKPTGMSRIQTFFANPLLLPTSRLKKKKKINLRASVKCALLLSHTVAKVSLNVGDGACVFLFSSSGNFHENVTRDFGDKYYRAPQIFVLTTEVHLIVSGSSFTSAVTKLCASKIPFRKAIVRFHANYTRTRF